MHTWRSEVRIGLIAGVTAGAVLWAATRLNTSTSNRATPSLTPVANTLWTPPLADPVGRALRALANGDTTCIAVADADSLVYPGVTPERIAAQGARSVRVYSPRSTGLSGAAWSAFTARAIPFAAAYNAVLQVEQRERTRTL